MDFPHEVRFFAGIGPAHFLADLRNAASSAFEEGAPFMGTALAAYRQCIGPRLSAFSPYFYILILFVKCLFFVFFESQEGMKLINRNSG